MWRECNDLLPTKSNLLRRGVVLVDICPLCTREAETLKHNFWICHSAQYVWGYGPKKFQKGTDTFINLFEFCMEQCDVMDLELMVVVAWKIWFHRNRVVHEEAFIHPRQVFQEASLSLDNFRRATVFDLAANSSTSTGSPLLWQPPPQVCTK
jgi:hypothetical protein